MKTGKRLIMASAVLAIVCLVTVPVHAGSEQQHRWEGVAIGVGAAILGHALLTSNGDHSGSSVTYAYAYRSHHAPPRYYGHRGYWRPYGWQRHHSGYHGHHGYKGHHGHYRQPDRHHGYNGGYRYNNQRPMERREQHHRGSGGDRHNGGRGRR